MCRFQCFCSQYVYDFVESLTPNKLYKMRFVFRFLLFDYEEQQNKGWSTIFKFQRIAHWALSLSRAHDINSSDTYKGNSQIFAPYHKNAWIRIGIRPRTATRTEVKLVSLHIVPNHSLNVFANIVANTKMLKMAILRQLLLLQQVHCTMPKS